MAKTGSKDGHSCREQPHGQMDIEPMRNTIMGFNKQAEILLTNVPYTRIKCYLFQCGNASTLWLKYIPKKEHIWYLHRSIFH